MRRFILYLFCIVFFLGSHARVLAQDVTVTPSVTPTATNTPVPTATPTGDPISTICVVAYVDINENGRFDSNEPVRAGVTIEIGTLNATVLTYVTKGDSEPFCLSGLGFGDYIVSTSNQTDLITLPSVVFQLGWDTETVGFGYSANLDDVTATTAPSVPATATTFVPISTPRPPEATPTANADGAIYYTVQPNDALWSIAARAGLTLPELLALNGLTEDSVIQAGDLLILGFADTPTPIPQSTVPPTLTGTRPPPTPTITGTPLPRTAICLAAYEDQNQDGIYQGGEPLRPDVAFTIFDETAVVANYITNGSEPYCLETLTPGTYNITRSYRADEILTTEGDGTILLQLGDVVNLFFGSYRNNTPIPPPPTLAPKRTTAPLATATAVLPTSIPSTAPDSPDRSGIIISILVLLALTFLGAAGYILRLMYVEKNK